MHKAGKIESAMLDSVIGPEILIDDFTLCNAKR